MFCAVETVRRARRLLAGAEWCALGSQGSQVAGVRDKEERRGAGWGGGGGPGPGTAGHTGSPG